VDCFIGSLTVSPDLALIYIQKKQLCLKKNQIDQLVYKLYDLTLEEIEIVEGFNEWELNRLLDRGKLELMKIQMIDSDDSSNPTHSPTPLPHPRPYISKIPQKIQ